MERHAIPTSYTSPSNLSPSSTGNATLLSSATLPRSPTASASILSNRSGLILLSRDCQLATLPDLLRLRLRLGLLDTNRPPSLPLSLRLLLLLLLRLRPRRSPSSISASLSSSARPLPWRRGAAVGEGGPSRASSRTDTRLASPSVSSSTSRLVRRGRMTSKTRSSWRSSSMNSSKWRIE
jgi:hypothetical protein